MRMHSSPVRDQSSNKFKITSMSWSNSKRKSQHYSPNDDHNHDHDGSHHNLNSKIHYSPIMGDDGSDEINYSKWCRQNQSGMKPPQSAFKFPPLDSDSIFFREDKFSRDATYLTRDHREQSFLQQSGDDTRNDELYHKDLGFEKSKFKHSSCHHELPTSKATSSKTSSSSSVSETCPSSSTSTTCLSELAQENGSEDNDANAVVAAALSDDSRETDMLSLLHPLPPSLLNESALHRHRQQHSQKHQQQQQDIGSSPYLFSSSASSSFCPDEYCSPLQREPTRKNRKSKMEMAQLMQNGNPRTFELKGSINIAQNAKNALTERLKSSPGGSKVLQRIIDYNNNSNNNSNTSTPQKVNTGLLFAMTMNDENINISNEMNIQNQLNSMQIDNNNNHYDGASENVAQQYTLQTPITSTSGSSGVAGITASTFPYRETAVTTVANTNIGSTNNNNNSCGYRFDCNNPPTSPYKRLLSPLSKPSFLHSSSFSSSSASSSQFANNCHQQPQQLQHSIPPPVYEVTSNSSIHKNNNHHKLVEIDASDYEFASSSGKSLINSEMILANTGVDSSYSSNKTDRVVSNNGVNNSNNNNNNNNNMSSPFRSVLYKDMFHSAAMMSTNISPIKKSNNNSHNYSSSSSSSSSFSLLNSYSSSSNTQSQKQQQLDYNENRKRKMTMTVLQLQQLSEPLKQSQSRSSATLSLVNYDIDGDNSRDSDYNSNINNHMNNDSYYYPQQQQCQQHMSGRQNPVQPFHYYEDDDDDDDDDEMDNARVTKLEGAGPTTVVDSNFITTATVTESIANALIKQLPQRQLQEQFQPQNANITNNHNNTNNNYSASNRFNIPMCGKENGSYNDGNIKSSKNHIGVSLFKTVTNGSISNSHSNSLVSSNGTLTTATTHSRPPQQQ